jgi:hypothetical protein
MINGDFPPKGPTKNFALNIKTSCPRKKHLPKENISSQIVTNKKVIQPPI